MPGESNMSVQSIPCSVQQFSKQLHETHFTEQRDKKTPNRKTDPKETQEYKVLAPPRAIVGEESVFRRKEGDE